MADEMFLTTSYRPIMPELPDDLDDLDEDDNGGARMELRRAAKASLLLYYQSVNAYNALIGRMKLPQPLRD